MSRTRVFVRTLVLSLDFKARLTASKEMLAAINERVFTMSPTLAAQWVMDEKYRVDTILIDHAIQGNWITVMEWVDDDSDGTTYVCSDKERATEMTYHHGNGGHVTCETFTFV